MVIFGFLAISTIIIAVFSFFTRYFQDSQGAFERLQSALEPAKEAWSPGDKFTLSPKEIGLVLDYSGPLLKAANWAPVALLGYAGILAVQLGLFFLPSAIVYIHMLRQQINSSDLHGSVLQPAGQQAIRKSYVLLIVETVGILLLDAAYMAVGFWIGLNPVEVMLAQGPHRSRSDLGDSTLRGHHHADLRLVGLPHAHHCTQSTARDAEAFAANFTQPLFPCRVKDEFATSSQPA